MTYDGTFLSVYGFLTSRAFRRVQERAIRSSVERVMAVQRHEEMKQHREPRTCVDPTHLRARGAIFFVLSRALGFGSHAPTWDLHAPTWVTKMSPDLMHFKAHLRGFDGGGGGV